MPWTGSSFSAKHNKKLKGAKAEKAASIANAILRSSGDEGMAIATANKMVGHKGAAMREKIAAKRDKYMRGKA